MSLCEIIMNFLDFLLEDEPKQILKVLSSNLLYGDKSICPDDPRSIPVVYKCYKCHECNYYRLEEGILENGDFYCNKHYS